MTTGDRWTAVLWDIGGVILDADSIERARELFVAALAAEHDLRTTEAIERWDRELGAYFRERDGQTFRPAHVGYARAIEAVVGDPVPVADWLPLSVQAAHVAFEPSDGAVETIGALADAGYYLGVVSDIDAWEAEFILTAFGLRDRFDHVTTSAEVGRTKPAPEVFETAIAKAPVGPERMLYVGDRYENDMRGGARAGLTTAAFGGTAASRANEGGVVDYVVEDLRDLLAVVGIE